MANEEQNSRLTAVASIHDPLRRALFDFISASGTAVGRDEAAGALGMARGTAAFHLDRLVDDGVLTVEFKRLSGKTGPGSGRPAKLYRRAAEELLVSIPERHYDLAGSVLASSIEESDRTGEPARQALSRVATERGRELGQRAGTLRNALEIGGYEPRQAENGDTILANCPFHSLAMSHTDVVCDANLNLLRGVAEGAGDTEHNVVFDPCDGQCCVRITARHGETDTTT
ncbi:helix-turn-helix transcriptional regulator [Homoserinimonas sp. A447]